ncbi:putative uncharacterized protein FLJ37770 [Myzus persicae]|uniref:putative uncharacterized protein FLJ37770 n=1 Tax=Myzus persicae TaxID=13164 RepID=UPI000B938051|nr:putative uncharacterized protein FLJ37770 [Myzus persicae]
MLDIKIEQRVNIKFLVKLKKTAAESFRMLCEVYGEECLSKARVFEWHKRFCSGRKDVEDDDRSGRPTTSSTNENGFLVGKQSINIIIKRYQLN